MKTLTNIAISHVLFLTLFAIGAYAFAQEEPLVCTDDAKQCPEGSYVSRGGPNCSFSPCPDAAEHRQEIKDNMAEKRAAAQETLKLKKEQVAEKKEVMQENRTERRAQLEDRMQERITNLAANMSNRMEAAIGRIQNIIDRLETRIEKLADKDVDTTSASTALASAQLSIDAALAKIATIDTEVANAVASEDVRTSWKVVRESFTIIRDYLKEAHQQLRLTVVELKAAVIATEGLNTGVSEAVSNNTDSETEAAN